MIDIIGGVGCWGLNGQNGVGGRGTIQLEIAHNDEDTKTPPFWIIGVVCLFRFVDPPPSGINHVVSLMTFLEPPPSGINYAIYLIYFLEPPPSWKNNVMSLLPLYCETAMTTIINYEMPIVTIVSSSKAFAYMKTMIGSKEMMIFSIRVLFVLLCLVLR